MSWSRAQAAASSFVSLILLFSTSAYADVWCVDAGGTVTDWEGCGAGTNCISPSPVTTIQAALDGMVGSPASICVATPDLHIESVVVDNSAGAIGGPTITFADATRFCPDPAVPETPGFRLIGETGADPPTEFQLADIQWQNCGPARFLEATDGTVTVARSRFLGGAGPFITATATDESVFVSILQSRLEGIAGQVYSGTPPLQLGSTEVSGSVGPVGSPLLEVTGSGGPLELFGAVLFGNVTLNAPLLRASSGLSGRRSAITANVVLGESPLVHLLAPGGASRVYVLSTSVVSRNRLLQSTTPPSPSILNRPSITPENHEYCLPWGTDQVALLPRELPRRRIGRIQPGPVRARSPVLWTLGGIRPSEELHRRQRDHGLGTGPAIERDRRRPANDPPPLHCEPRRTDRGRGWFG